MAIAATSASGLLARLRRRVLPNDRPASVQGVRHLSWRDVNFGLGVIAGSGRSLTNMAANPNYDRRVRFQSPCAARARPVDGFPRAGADGFQVDFHTDYTVTRPRLRLVSADMFNLFNRREPDNYDYCSDRLQRPNANFGQAINGCSGVLPSYQAPFATRVGVRFDW